MVSLFPSRNLSLHSRIQGWMGVCTDYGRIYRAKTVVLSVKDLRSLCTRSRGTFEGRNLADRDINPVSEHRERERERRGRQLCEIHISSLSCNRYPRSTRLPRSPAPRWQPLFRDGDDPFCDDESRRRCADVDEVYGAAITRHGASS